MLTHSKQYTTEVIRKADELVDCYRDDMEPAIGDGFQFFPVCTDHIIQLWKYCIFKWRKTWLAAFQMWTWWSEFTHRFMAEAVKVNVPFQVPKKKTCLQSTGGHEKLLALSLLFKERDLLHWLDLDDVISNFAKNKQKGFSVELMCGPIQTRLTHCYSKHCQQRVIVIS